MERRIFLGRVGSDDSFARKEKQRPEYVAEKTPSSGKTGSALLYPVHRRKPSFLSSFSFCPSDCVCRDQPGDAPETSLRGGALLVPHNYRVAAWVAYSILITPLSTPPHFALSFPWEVSAEKGNQMKVWYCVAKKKRRAEAGSLRTVLQMRMRHLLSNAAA